MSNPFVWGVPQPTDALLAAVAAIIPVFFIALVVAAVPALAPNRIVRGRFSILSTLPAMVAMAYVELQSLGFLGEEASRRPGSLGWVLLWETGLIMAGTIWTIVAADFLRRKAGASIDQQSV